MTVNVFESVGHKIIENMIDRSEFTHKLMRKEKAKTLGDTSAVRIAPDRTIDPALLFQRFLGVPCQGIFHWKRFVLQPSLKLGMSFGRLTNLSSLRLFKNMLQINQETQLNQMTQS